MPNIGDALPEELRREHAQRHLCPGEVLFLYCEDYVKHHDKYVLVLACHVNADLLYGFFISSAPRRGARETTSQILLDPNAYPFLDHTSYLDSGDVKRLSLPDAVDQIVEEPARVKGKLSKEMVDRVLLEVERSYELAVHDKEIIIAGLRTAYPLRGSTDE
jgi:hypothetical protein